MTGPSSNPRPRVDQLTDDMLDALHAQLEASEAATAMFKARAEQAEAAIARVRALHERYRSALTDDFDCCSEYNRIANDLVPYRCPTLRALDGTA